MIIHLQHAILISLGQGEPWQNAGAMQLGWKPGGAERAGDFLTLGCSWNFFSVWHLWKVNRYNTWWKSQQHQGPSLIAYLLYCLFSREISLNKEQEMLQYLSRLGQGFEKFKIFLGFFSLFWKRGNSPSEYYWENCFLACCFVQNLFVNKDTNEYFSLPLLLSPFKAHFESKLKRKKTGKYRLFLELSECRINNLVFLDVSKHNCWDSLNNGSTKSCLHCLNSRYDFGRCGDDLKGQLEKQNSNSKSIK